MKQFKRQNFYSLLEASLVIVPQYLFGLTGLFAYLSAKSIYNGKVINKYEKKFSSQNIPVHVPVSSLSILEDVLQRKRARRQLSQIEIDDPVLKAFVMLYKDCNMPEHIKQLVLCDSTGLKISEIQQHVVDSYSSEHISTILGSHLKKEDFIYNFTQQLIVKNGVSSISAKYTPIYHFDKNILETIQNEIQGSEINYTFAKSVLQQQNNMDFVNFFNTLNNSQLDPKKHVKKFLNLLTRFHIIKSATGPAANRDLPESKELRQELEIMVETQKEAKALHQQIQNAPKKAVNKL